MRCHIFIGEISKIMLIQIFAQSAGISGLDNDTHEWLSDGSAGKSSGGRVGFLRAADVDPSTVGIRFAHTSRNE